MKYPYAFFDVDSLELSPKGITYNCHPKMEAISEMLYEVYSIISGVAAPLVFSIDMNSNTPENTNSRRRDFLSIPVNQTETNWKESVPDWYKFYLKREACDDESKTAIFNNNTNARDCVKLIQASEWIVFGNGDQHGVDHVISNLLKTVETVKFIPDLIVSSTTESAEQLRSNMQKWEEQGAIAISYDDVIELARCHQF